jgi:phosphopantothenoylcysteine decarboxylase/phosphopantothenate--cysteine ligase
MAVLNEMSRRLSGRQIALCVTGSIASVESIRLARELRRHGANVTFYMSKGAQKILHPNALEFASGKEPVTEITGLLEHLRKFDLVIVAPATANTISKLVLGIADNPVTTLVLSTNSNKVIIAPSMHKEMYSSPTLMRNLKSLRAQYIVAEPVFEEEVAKMASIDDIVELTFYAVTEKVLMGKKVVVTAGPTSQPIDPVRVLTNRSSGKMGIAMAMEAFYRGADVILIYGPGCEKVPRTLKTIRAERVDEMIEALRSIKNYHIFIAAAAVSDFTFKTKKEKIDSRKGTLNLRFEAAPRILSEVNEDAMKIGFKAEFGVSEDELVSRAKALALEHNLDLVVANDVSKGVFGSVENEVVIVKGEITKRLGRMKKREIAEKIFDMVNE